MRRTGIAFLLSILSCFLALADEMELRSLDGSRVILKADSMIKDEKGNIHASGKIELRHPPVLISCLGDMNLPLSHGHFASCTARGIVEASVGKRTLWGREISYEATRRLVAVEGEPRAREGGVVYSAQKRILCYADTGVIRCEPSTAIHVERASKRGNGARRRKFLGLF